APWSSARVSDLSESPAVPPIETGGGERLGYFLGGGTLIALGWGVGIGLNWGLHRIAPATGMALGPLRIFASFGPFAWALAVVWLVSGGVGVHLVWPPRPPRKGAFGPPRPPVRGSRGRARPSVG